MTSPEASLGILGTMLAMSVEVGGIFVPASQVENTLHKFCKKLFIHTGDPQFPYQFFGSATALKRFDKHMLFCCGHQIDQFNAETVSFLHDETNTTISSSRKIWPTINESNKDTDWIDVRGLEYPVSKYGIANLPSHFFTIQTGVNVWPSNFDKELLIFGYPTDQQNVDYEIPHIHAAAVFVTGRYDGQTNSPHLHRIRMARKEAFNTDGMSGGPVFYLGTRGLGKYFVGFAGIVMRGSADSDLIHFIDAEFILKMLEFE